MTPRSSTPPRRGPPSPSKYLLSRNGDWQTPEYESKETDPDSELRETLPVRERKWVGGKAKLGHKPAAALGGPNNPQTAQLPKCFSCSPPEQQGIRRSLGSRVPQAPLLSQHINPMSLAFLGLATSAALHHTLQGPPG